LRNGGRLLRKKVEAGLSPAQVAESNGEREREQNYENLSYAPVARLFFIVEQVVEV
jgi:hypothetical protein